MLDLYVVPAARGRAIALALACAVAARVIARGGIYLKGTAVAGGTGRRLYERIVVSGATRECIVGGRALRRLAALAGEAPRVMAVSLPPTAWNHEA